VSTILFAALVALLSAPLGWVLADVVALGACSIANTAANRRLTFSLQGRAGRGRHYAGGLALSILPIGVTFVALAGLAVTSVGSVAVRVAVLTAASAAAAVARFVLLRRWVFGR
jgi:putative flippase GtrA